MAILQWNGRQFENELNKVARNAVKDIAKRLTKAIKTEAPIKTGNLRRSTLTEGIFETSRSIGANVGSNEDKETGAYYAPFVYYPGVTRNYRGNPYIDRAIDRVKLDFTNISTTIQAAIDKIRI